MTSSHKLILMIAVLLLVGLGVGTWVLLHGSSTGAQSHLSQQQQLDAAAAARVAAELPTQRAAVLNPNLTDDPNAVPVYPPGTTITLEQDTWVPIGITASAYADIEPTNQRVIIDFSKHQGRWYIDQLEQKP